jgi:citrate lyase subunit beta / citryl-CoA lyase
MTAGRAEAGRRGEEIRSDCWIALTLAQAGGIEICLKSKVESMYGDAIRRLVRDELAAFNLRHAKVEIEDAGALPFVIMARLEAAVRRLGIDVGDGRAPDRVFGEWPGTQRDRLRRSRLYLPGNEPKFMINAGLHEPDTIILDLEDSVAPEEKDEARILVRNALCAVDFRSAERMVRVNQDERGLEDIAFVAPFNLHVLVIPKVESPEQVTRVDDRVKALLAAKGVDRPVYLMPIVESALGAIRAYEIATASDKVVALTIGLEDYCADIGAERTAGGRESFWARSQIVNAARAAGVQPIASVFSDVEDMAGLREAALDARVLGFDGMGCIHPRQISVIHDAFAPSADEVDRARRVVEAYEHARERGLNVVALDGRMIDPPVVKRAQRIVRIADEMSGGRTECR